VGRGSAQEVTPRFCTHASANAVQRIGAMMNTAVKPRRPGQRHTSGFACAPYLCAEEVQR
jgi:hypothetical protein